MGAWLKRVRTLKMSHENKLWIEGHIFALLEQKNSYFMIKKYNDMHSTKISK